MTNSVVVAVVSDIHCGSTVAMVPPEGVRLDDGGTYHPSKVQSWLWKCWEDFWTRVGALKRSKKADLYIIWNGDLFEGDHHRTTQIISSNPETSDYLIDRIYSIPKGIKPKHQFVVRGTEAHVGASGAAEEAFARRIRATKDETNDTWSWWHLRADINGNLIDAQHHGKLGRLPWTKANAVNQQAAHIFHEHAMRKQRWPDLAFRAHMHRFADSYKNHPVRVVQMPCWQMKTAFAHKVAPNTPPDIGGIVTVFDVDGNYTVDEILYVPKEDKAWRE